MSLVNRVVLHRKGCPETCLRSMAGVSLKLSLMQLTVLFLFHEIFFHASGYSPGN